MPTAMADVVVLAVLQGLTEFLPVSSSGHLALAGLLFGIEEGHPALGLMLRAGTFCATVLVLRRRIGDLFLSGLSALRRPSLLQRTSDGRDLVVVLVATIPTAVLAFALEHPVERWTRSPWMVGLGFVITGLLLVSARWARPIDPEGPTAFGAAAIGVAQGMALVPGISRSGSTIVLGLWLGVRPERSFELSMLMSLPAAFGSIVLEAPEVMGSMTTLGPAVVGAAVSFGVGVAAVLVLRSVVNHGRLPVFALWVLPLALATLALARVWPGAH